MNEAILPVKVLLIENDLAAAEAIRAALAASGEDSFDLQWVRELSEGLQRLKTKGIAAALIELDLPDSQGLATFDSLFTAAPNLPILILGGDSNEALAKEAVQRGAQDYILPTHLDSYSLSRALRNAIERKAVEDALFLKRERAVVTLSSIGDAVLCTDISGNITYLNLVAETMTGWCRQEAIGKPLAEVCTRILAPSLPRGLSPSRKIVDSLFPSEIGCFLKPAGKRANGSAPVCRSSESLSMSHPPNFARTPFLPVFVTP